MKETSSDPSYLDRIRSSARAKAHGVFGRSPTKPHGSILPVSNRPNQLAPTEGSGSNTTSNNGATNHSGSPSTGNNVIGTNEKSIDPSDNTNGQVAPAAASSQDAGQGAVVEGEDEKKAKPKILTRIAKTTKAVLLHSWINVLLVFVPVGIIVGEVHGIHVGIVFGINCIAIIPLAGLLSHATESVARKLGDATGALLNVTFGNAVELIIFIALSKGQIRIVQAALLGSILANLLMILGMCFFLGGLRFREQIYNSTVTQMSACLLSLSVCSLVLPTAFHASFSDPQLADTQALKISRGCSIILLLVYAIYLLFQLKSHAYMYESTPQHIVDAESTPGPAAAWLDSSSSDDSSSSSSDSDGSSRSRDTMRKRMKKVLRGRRRKNSVASVETGEMVFTRTPSFGTTNMSPTHDDKDSESSGARPPFPRFNSVEGSEEAAEEERARRHHKSDRRHKHGKHRKYKKASSSDALDGAGEVLQPTISERPENTETTEGEPRRVDFAIPNGAGPGESWTSGGRRPLPGLRAMSIKNLAPTVFVQKPEPGVPPPVPAGPVPRVRYGIRRTNSLPDRLNQQHQIRPPGAMLPAQIPLMALTGGNGVEPMEHDDDDDHLSRTAAIILLLISTGLVALCAEFVVDSIKEVVETGNVSETFIGLIVLPIVGNAAEHVTAITVALKNKMDLAIGVAVGSSIQIALFITPLVVILGWAMDKEMTLYFTLFETVCLFVSAFIVNFLVLDGRSNYLEGALLLCTYIIIGVVAAFYPDGDNQASNWG